MPFDLAETDRLLSTTRSVRRRLDLERPVSEELLLECIDLAEQAPTGGNQPSRRWLVIRDPKVKARVADVYREAGGAWLSERAAALAGTGDGTLLAGPSASSLDGGAVDVVRREASQVSTVDVTDSAAGRAVTALALARVAAGETGAWGTSRSEDGSVPR